jgi:hypothetical protein
MFGDNEQRLERIKRRDYKRIDKIFKRDAYHP